MTLISLPCRKPGSDLTPQARTCLSSPHQVTVCISSHERPLVVEDWFFLLKMDWMHPLFLQRPAPPLKISSRPQNNATVSFHKYHKKTINETVITAKETKHLCKRIWRRNKSTFNRSQYMQKVHQYHSICMQAKSQFLKAKIQDNHHNPQKLWRVLCDVLHRLPAKIVPSIKPLQLLADRFVEFFTEKN